MRFATSPPLRGPGLGSSATHSMPTQGPTSREMSSPGVYVLTYHPPPGASANRYPWEAQAAENTGNTSPFPSRRVRSASNSFSLGLTTTQCKGAGLLSGILVVSPLHCFAPNLVVTSRSFSHAVYVRAPDADRSQPEALSPAPPLRWRNPIWLSLAIVPRPCLGLVTVCKAPVRITSRARLRRCGKNRRRQRRLLALQPLPRVQISSLLLRLHLGLMEISAALLWLASWP